MELTDWLWSWKENLSLPWSVAWVMVFCFSTLVACFLHRLIFLFAVGCKEQGGPEFLDEFILGWFLV